MLTDTATLGKWNGFFCSSGNGKGVCISAEAGVETSYCLILRTEEDLSRGSSEHVTKTVKGFTFAGEEMVLLTTVQEVESW